METQSKQISLRFGSYQLRCDLENGAAITYLKFGDVELLKPHENIDQENPWLFPFPNRLRNGEYSFGGNQYQFPHNDYGRPNALHGFVLNRSFYEVNRGGDEKSQWVEVAYYHDGKLEYYPFPCQLKIRFSLSTHGLGLNLTATNQGPTDMPVGLGWHPYFHLPSQIGKAEMKLPPCHEVEVDEILLPTGKKWPSTCFDNYRSLKGLSLDTCFALDRRGEKNSTYLKSGEDFELEIWQDEAHQFIQVYTPEDGQTVAIEPVTCGIDAFNTGEGLKILSPGESWRISCGVRQLLS